MDYDAVVESLANVSEAMRRYQHQLIAEVTIIHALKEFEKVVRRCPESYRLQLVEEYIYEFEYLKVALGKLKSKSCTSFCDGVLRNLLHIDSVKTYNVSYIFEEFIKGITYFRYQQEPNVTPIYHRLYSCGSKNLPPNHMSCKGKQASAEQRLRTETCYIEKLIHYRIFNALKFYFSASGEPPTQNEAYVRHMEYLKQMYESCFPSCGILVDVDFEESTIPTRVTITRTHKSRVISEATYVKTYTRKNIGIVKYTMITECSRVVNGKQYVKFQTFFRESKWVLKKTSHQSLPAPAASTTAPNLNKDPRRPIAASA